MYPAVIGLAVDGVMSGAAGDGPGLGPEGPRVSAAAFEAGGLEWPPVLVAVVVGGFEGATITGAPQGETPTDSRIISQRTGMPDGAGSAGMLASQRAVRSQAAGSWESSQAKAIHPQPCVRA